MEFLVLLGSTVVTVAIVWMILWQRPAMRRARRAHERYDRYAREVLAGLPLQPSPVRPAWQTLRPRKALWLFTVAATTLRGGPFAWVNLSRTAFFPLMKLHTLFLRADPMRNLPMLSIDVIMMGRRRIFVIEIIDPAHQNDEVLRSGYARLRALKPAADQLADEPVTRWYRDVVTDFSIHAKTDDRQDDLLFATYQAYLAAYLELAEAACPVDTERAQAIDAAVRGYVERLVSEGGPAVDLLEKLLGTEQMRAYARTVMFGL